MVAAVGDQLRGKEHSEERDKRPAPQPMPIDPTSPAERPPHVPIFAAGATACIGARADPTLRELRKFASWRESASTRLRLLGIDRRRRRLCVGRRSPAPADIRAVSENVGVLPVTRYARSGEVSIAYQVLGEGPFDVVFVPPQVSNVELGWEVPNVRVFLEGLASFSRLIHFDKRGTGLSDRVAGAPSLEVRMDDVRAVMDGAGCERAAVVGWSEGVAMSALFAATYPERAWALVLYGGKARELRAPDYPWGESEAEALREIAEWRAAGDQGAVAEELVQSGMPSGSAEEVAAMVRLIRQSTSPGALEALDRMNIQIDIRNVLPAIRVPTLVLHNRRDRWVELERGKDLARRIPGASFVEFPIEGHITPAAETPPVLDEIERFLRGAWQTAGSPRLPERVLATVLFTDIVGSTDKAAELGDAHWRELLQRHHQLIRRELSRARGIEVDTSGDGFFASFDGPERAIRCACAITETVKAHGLEVRAGLHTGECELVDGKIAGIAVHTGARVAAAAKPSEVIVSSTVKDLVAGSDLTFEERGVHQLKGIPGEWRLYSARC
jgi:class 3 adenylate cyclase/dienelactone hydrolase